MKHWMIAIGLVLGATLVGCGGSSNPCQQVANEFEQGVDEECAEQSDCQFCECWEMGQVVNDTGDGCTDPEGGMTGGSCSGEDRENAQMCVDSSECLDMTRQEGRDSTAAACSI